MVYTVFKLYCTLCNQLDESSILLFSLAQRLTYYFHIHVHCKPQSIRTNSMFLSFKIQGEFFQSFAAVEIQPRNQVFHCPQIQTQKFPKLTVKVL